MRKFKDSQWNCANDEGRVASWDCVIVSVLMDIRDELKALNNGVLPLRHLDCTNFLQMPMKLDRIARNTHKPKRRRKSALPEDGR